MKCTNCGKEIANDSKFCEYCGTKVKKAKSRKPFWIVLALCVIALFVGIIIYYENELEYYRYNNYDNYEECVDTVPVEDGIEDISDDEVCDVDWNCDTAAVDTVVDYY